MSPGMNTDNSLVYASECMCIYLCICEGLYRYVYICVRMCELGGYVYVGAYVWVHVYM